MLASLFGRYLMGWDRGGVEIIHLPAFAIRETSGGPIVGQTSTRGRRERFSRIGWNARGAVENR